MARKADALHQRNGDRAVDYDIRYCAARDRAEERRRNHGDFRRTAAVPTGGDQCQVGEKFITADGVECLAKKNKGNDDAGSDVNRQT